MSSVMRLTNGTVEVIVAQHFGPRVLRYAFVGGDNLLAETLELSTRTVLGEWRTRGGHRLWVAPEMMPGSYAPDSEPVACECHGSLAVAVQQRPDRAGIEKRLHISLDPRGTRVSLTHTITNRTLWPIRVAPWAITVVASDGVAVAPQPPYRSHDEALLPSGAIVQWPFTDLADSRWSFGSRLIRLRPDAAKPDPQKLGVANGEGWCALLRGTTVFLKQFRRDPDAQYPDYGSNNEFYTAGAYLEIETLGPLSTLVPGASASHVEGWSLFRDVALGASEQQQYERLRALSLDSPGSASSP